MSRRQEAHQDLSRDAHIWWHDMNPDMRILILRRMNHPEQWAQHHDLDEVPEPIADNIARYHRSIVGRGGGGKYGPRRPSIMYPHLARQEDIADALLSGDVEVNEILPTLAGAAGALGRVGLGAVRGLGAAGRAAGRLGRGAGRARAGGAVAGSRGATTPASRIGGIPQDPTGDLGPDIVQALQRGDASGGQLAQQIGDVVGGLVGAGESPADRMSGAEPDDINDPRTIARRHNRPATNAYRGETHLGEMSTALDPSEQEYFDYLDQLRDSAQTNMMCAGQYLVDEFGLDRREARRVLMNWMTNYSDDRNTNPDDYRGDPGRPPSFSRHESEHGLSKCPFCGKPVKGDQYECANCGRILGESVRTDFLSLLRGEDPFIQKTDPLQPWWDSMSEDERAKFLCNELRHMPLIANDQARYCWTNCTEELKLKIRTALGTVNQPTSMTEGAFMAEIVTPDLIKKIRLAIEAADWLRDIHDAISAMNESEYRSFFVDLKKHFPGDVANVIDVGYSAERLLQSNEGVYFLKNLTDIREWVSENLGRPTEETPQPSIPEAIRFRIWKDAEGSPHEWEFDTSDELEACHDFLSKNESFSPACLFTDRSTGRLYETSCRSVRSEFMRLLAQTRRRGYYDTDEEPEHRVTGMLVESSVGLDNMFRDYESMSVSVDEAWVEGDCDYCGARDVWVTAAAGQKQRGGHASYGTSICRHCAGVKEDHATTPPAAPTDKDYVTSPDDSKRQQKGVGEILPDDPKDTTGIVKPGKQKVGTTETHSAKCGECNGGGRSWVMNPETGEYEKGTCETCHGRGKLFYTGTRDRPESMSESVDGVSPTARKREKTLDRWIVRRNSFDPSGPIAVQETIDPGIYDIVETMGGIAFEVAEISTDRLLKFEDKRYNLVLNEIAKFWELRPNYNEMGFAHKRGMLLYGAPGTGKSCLLKLVMDDIVNEGDIVVRTRRPRTLREGLTQMRDIEPDRRILVVLEDIDELVKYDEHEVLQLFDGAEQVDNILYLATTNYVENLPARILRPGRFDRKIHIGTPPADGRRVYLEDKLGMKEGVDVAEFVKKTDGFTFAQLREFIVGAFCIGDPIDEVIHRLRNGLEEKRIDPATVDMLIETLHETGTLSPGKVSGIDMKHDQNYDPTKGTRDSKLDTDSKEHPVKRDTYVSTVGVKEGDKVHWSCNKNGVIYQNREGTIKKVDASDLHTRKVTVTDSESDEDFELDLNDSSCSVQLLEPDHAIGEAAGQSRRYCPNCGKMTTHDRVSGGSTGEDDDYECEECGSVNKEESHHSYKVKSRTPGFGVEKAIEAADDGLDIEQAADDFFADD